MVTSFNRNLLYTLGKGSKTERTRMKEKPRSTYTANFSKEVNWLHDNSKSLKLLHLSFDKIDCNYKYWKARKSEKEAQVSTDCGNQVRKIHDQAFSFDFSFQGIVIDVEPEVWSRFNQPLFVANTKYFKDLDSTLEKLTI